MSKSKEIYVAVSDVTLNKKDVETSYQKTMPPLVQKLTVGALAKAKSKGLTTQKPRDKKAKGFQLSPKLKMLKNLGSGDKMKIQCEVSYDIVEVEGSKIVAKVTIITEGATVIPPSPPPKKIEGEYQAAVEAAATGGIQKAIKKMIA